MIAELPPLTSDKWFYESNDRMSKYNFRSAVDLGDHGFQFISTVHSAGFLRFLSEITGVEALLPDPYLTGAGYHVYPSGGQFDVHADRNMDFYCGLERRLVMLTYLNRDWKECFGGQLELWNKEGTRCERVIEPMFNRTVIFEITDNNFHGVRPIVGRDVFRSSLILYFHTANSHLVPHESIFSPHHHPSKKTVIKRIGKELTPPFITKLAQRYVAKRS
jgi:2OG-Fe(II) oxygenase superfamily